MGINCPRNQNTEASQCAQHRVVPRGEEGRSFTFKPSEHRSIRRSICSHRGVPMEIFLCQKKCFVLSISKVATYSYRTDAQDLNSDQQGNLGQLSADPANFYHFGLCFKSHCKASVRKRITSGYPTRRTVLIFIFFLNIP